MLLFMLLLALSAAYAIRYAVHCFLAQRPGAGFAALFLALPPLSCIAALIVVMARQM